MKWSKQLRAPVLSHTTGALLYACCLFQAWWIKVSLSPLRGGRAAFPTLFKMKGQTYLCCLLLRYIHADKNCQLCRCPS